MNNNRELDPLQSTNCLPWLHLGWLMVVLQGQTMPVVWRALKDEWSLMCDEVRLRYVST